MHGNEALSSLELQHLTVNYEKTAVLWDINLSIPKGNCVGIVGPNGAGKSTLLKAAMGLIESSSGKALFFGKSLNKVRGKIGYVPQRSSVDWDFPITALDLVLMGLYRKMGLIKWVTSHDRKAAAEALEMVGMHGFANRQIGQLSGGQQQRIFIARALIQNADLYLMDEPFAGVDAATEKMLISLFEKLKQEGKTLLIVHHDLATVKAYFDWVVMLNTCLIAAGPTATVFNPENIARTYGRSSELLEEAAKMVQNIRK